MAFKIGGVTIKAPTTFDIEKFKLTKSGRIADGSMTFDVIAKKRKFYFKYTFLSSVHLTIIETALDVDSENTLDFFTLTFEEDNIEKTATVYPGAVKKTLARTGSIWYWKDVSFDLIEK